MRLEKMTIKNYRQFEDVTILYNNDLTILAGANNSGKTSLVELYKNIFIKTEKNFTVEDMPAKKIYTVINDLVDMIIKIYEEHPNEEEFLNEIGNSFLKEASVLDDTLKIFQEIIVDIEVYYEETEKISRFSDYLMELDSQNKCFYFRYALQLNGKKMHFCLKENFSKLEDKIKDIINADSEKYNNKKAILNDYILKLYDLCLEENYYFCNHTFTIKIPMKAVEFKKLFNCGFISATRELNDQKEDQHYSISEEMLKILALDENWETIIANIPGNIIESINKSEVRQNIESGSIKGLQDTIKEIAATTNGNVGEISLNVNIDDEDIMLFLIKAIEARYQYNNVYLNEASQGLGFSNWIYIYLRIEKFCKQTDNEIVNFFIIEEPEAHMHPQMQRALIKHLNSSYNRNQIQGIITTHSHELIRASQLEKIRVIRQVVPFINKIFDMNYFKSKLNSDEERDFFNLLFSINYSDLIFSNKIIMYEGDTEKLFIETLLKHPEFSKLSDQYISFVQVGGAYAHNYKKLISFLGIKTLVITDIDYSKTLTQKDEILKDETSNACIKSYYIDELRTGLIRDLILTVCENCQDETELCFKNFDTQRKLDMTLYAVICEKISTNLSLETKKILERKPTINDIYNWNQPHDNKIHIQYQNSDDNFARTLEEAMLSKYLNMSLTDMKTRQEWKQIRKDTELKFSIPAQTEEEKLNGNEKRYNIRDVVLATGDSKTDFMYSVILKKKEIDMLPCYLKEGLEWLQK